MFSTTVGLSFLCFFATTTVLVNGQRDGYCLTNDNDPYLQFSTKTAYEFVKGKENSQYAVAECQPIMFWSYNRHGTRLPGKMGMEDLPSLMKTRDDIISNYEVRRTAPDQGRLCAQDIENLKSWRWNTNFTQEFANDLTYQGYDDLKYLAIRWKSKFRDILPGVYSPNNYLFRYTNRRRTKSSYGAFVDGLFGRGAADNIPQPIVEQNDPLLMAYDFCNTWIREVAENPLTLEQMENFKKKEEYKNMIQNVSLHLGYKYPLEEKKIRDIYDMCRYDKSWEIHKNSPWCAAFTKDQLRLLEYVEDLKYYYMSGYGNKLNKKLGCTPLKDMMDRFTAAIERPDQGQPKTVVYFTHSKMIQSFISALGIAEDSVPLLADNYHTPNIQRRKWRTSRIDPFASNIAAILHRCQDNEKYKVMFFLNEIPVEFNDCHVGLCSWDLLKRKYAKAVNECNLDFCTKSSASSPPFSFYATIGSIVMILCSKLIHATI